MPVGKAQQFSERVCLAVLARGVRWELMSSAIMPSLYVLVQLEKPNTYLPLPFSISSSFLSKCIPLMIDYTARPKSMSFTPSAVLDPAA